MPAEAPPARGLKPVDALERPTPGRREAPHGGPAGRPSCGEVERAVRTLIAWAGDDPDRPGLRDTPSRVARAFGELFAGYRTDPVSVLRRSLMAAESAGQLVLLRSIRFASFCEHHLLPFTGHADVGYVPRHHVVGLGAVAAAVEAVARRLQIQERMTDELAAAVDEALEPLGVAVVVRAEHQCLAARGPCKAGTRLVTSRQLGSLAADQGLGRAFFELVGGPAPPGAQGAGGAPPR